MSRMTQETPPLAFFNIDTLVSTLKSLLLLLKHFVNKNRQATILIADNFINHLHFRLKRIDPISFQKENQSSCILCATC